MSKTNIAKLAELRTKAARAVEPTPVPHGGVIPHRLYGLREVADILGVPVYTVRQYIKTGQLGVKRVRKNAWPRVPGQAILDFARKYEGGTHA